MMTVMSLVGVVVDEHCLDCGVDTTGTVTQEFDVDVDVVLSCCGRTVEFLRVDVIELLHDDCGA